MQSKTSTKSKSALIVRFLRGSTHFFVFAIVMTLLSAVADMITPQIIRVAVDNVIGGKEPTLAQWIMDAIESIGGFGFLHDNLWVLALAVIAVALIKVFSQYLFRVYNTKGSETLVKTMRDSLFTHIERLPFSWHMKNQTGDIIQRCTSDIDMVRNFVSEQMTSIVRIVIYLILALTFMFSMNVSLALIAMIPTPLILWYSMHFHKNIGEGFRNCDENEGKLSAMVQENLTGVRVVRAFGRERREKDRFTAHNQYYTSLWENMARLMGRFWSVSDFMSMSQSALIVFFGVIFCVNGRITAGEYIAFITYNALLTWPIRQLGRMIAELSKAGVSVERIQYIMDSPVEQDKPDARKADVNGDIVFDHVTFTYDGSSETLKDVSFTAKQGSTIGILGGTGSGKSTLMYLLDKLYDLPEDGGRITIGGTDIRDINTEHLRSNIGIVLQEPFLFSRSLGENIGITRKGIDMAEIHEAARSACLDETIDSFSKGYDTFVGERGVTLSGGQKQRAAIARTLVQKTPIMIFDDSLSAVDTATDAKIRKELEARFGTATIFLISHRITTLSKADKIIVMEHGRIAEQGTPDELRDAGGIYSKIYAIQALTKEEALL